MRLFMLATLLTVIGGCASAQSTIERSLAPQASLEFPDFAASDSASTVTVDNSVWTDFLTTYVAAGPDDVMLVNYRAVTDADRSALQGYIDRLEATDPTTLTSDDQLAFWINLYNAVTVNLILAEYPVDSIRDIKDGLFDVGGPWNDKRTTVNGIELTLNDVEHSIVRPIFADPRIHYAVNCASIGCPDLRPQAFEGDTLDASLTEQARAYINHPRGISVNKRGKITASSIFNWYGSDFGVNEAEVLDHIRQYAEPTLLEQLEGATKISKYSYDWSLNEPAQ